MVSSIICPQAFFHAIILASMQPSVFQSIIGHTNAQTVLCRMANENKLPHALLFVGAHHLGKTLMARQLIKFLFGYPSSLESHLDFIELARLIDEKTGKKKSNISVEQVRDMCERVSLSSLHGGWKIVFVKEANHLSVAAANAFLKTLEEPKGKMLFILRTPSLESVPATIASRSQIIRFHSVDRQALTEAIVKKGFARPDAIDAAAYSLGRPGNAMRFLIKSEERAQSEIRVTQAVQLFCGSVKDQMRTIAQQLPKEDVNKKNAADQILKGWECILRDVFLTDVGCRELIAHTRHKERIDELHANMKQRTILNVLHKIRDARDALHHNTNPLLTLEHILFTTHLHV